MMKKGKTLTIALALFLGCSQVLIAACVHTISGVGSGRMGVTSAGGGGVPFTSAEFVITTTSDTCQYRYDGNPDLFRSPGGGLGGEAWIQESVVIDIEILGVGAFTVLEDLDLIQYDLDDGLDYFVGIGIDNGVVSPFFFSSLDSPRSSSLLPLASGDPPLVFSSMRNNRWEGGDGFVSTDGGLLQFDGFSEGAFTFSAIPEPSIAMLSAFALLGIARARRRPR